MKIGLLLAGGMGKGAYQIGALRAIEKYIPYHDFSIISGSSVGCLNGYAFSSGQLDRASALWESLNTVSDSMFIKDVVQGSYLKKAINELTLSPVSADSFYFPLFEMKLRNRSATYFDMAKIDSAERRDMFLRASVAVFTMCRAVNIDGKKYYDGAIVDNTPTFPFNDQEFDYIIALYFDHAVQAFNGKKFRNKVIKICFDDGGRIKSEAYITNKSVQDMIKYGEKYTDKVLSYIFKNGTQPDEVRARIKSFERTKMGRGKRKIITASRGISVLNKIVKSFVRTKKQKPK